MKTINMCILFLFIITSFTLAQTNKVYNIDTVDYIRRVEKKLFILVNERRVHKKLDTLYLQDDLKQFCEENNKRMLEYHEVLSFSFETNKRFRQIAHQDENTDSFNTYVKKLANVYGVKVMDLPFDYQENAGVDYYEFTDISPEDLAIKMYIGYMMSPDHRASLLDKLGISLSISVSYGKTLNYSQSSNVFVSTIIVKVKDPNIK